MAQTVQSNVNFRNKKERLNTPRKTSLGTIHVEMSRNYIPSANYELGKCIFERGTEEGTYDSAQKERVS
jgi:hypothetical protein